MDHVMTLQRAVLATDGSEHSQAATDFACALAWGPGSIISVATVVEVPKPSAGAISRMERQGIRDWRRVLRTGRFAARDQALQDVAHAAESLRGCHPSIDVDEVVCLGEPAAELLQLIIEVEAELVIAGSRGSSPLEDQELGGVSDALVTEAPCPVLIVHRAADELATVLVAVRAPDDADRLADACLRLPLPPATALVAVTVTTRLPRVEPGHEPSAAGGDVEALLEAWEEGDRAEAEAAGLRFVERVHATAPHRAASARVVEIEPDPSLGNVRADAGAAFLAEAASLDAALIVVGAREPVGAEMRQGLGSVSRKIVRGAPNAVLVVRGAATTRDTRINTIAD